MVSGRYIFTGEHDHGHHHSNCEICRAQDQRAGESDGCGAAFRQELQQLAAVFGMVKAEYVEPVDEKKLIGDAISGMVAGLDTHSQYFDKKSFRELWKERPH